MKTRLIIFLFLFSNSFFAQEKKYTSEDITVNTFIEGTLTTPKNANNLNLVILIAGSGPTDRDGNQNFLKSDALKKLALGLTENNIAVFRYDKRIVKQIRKGNVDNNMLFDDFVTDATSAIDHFKESNRFKKIYVAGHSQGSLVGLLASKDKVDGFISLAGAGQPIDLVIMEQIAKTAPMFTEEAQKVFNVLKEGKTTKEYPPALASLFNETVQPFISNWMQYNPQEEIKKLEMPILIINGTKDLQVTEEEAKLLKEASPHATLAIITKMNHILVPIEGGDLENSKSYNEAFRPLSTELIETIVEFIN